MTQNYWTLKNGKKSKILLLCSEEKKVFHIAEKKSTEIQNFCLVRFSRKEEEEEEEKDDENIKKNYNKSISVVFLVAFMEKKS